MSPRPETQGSAWEMTQLFMSCSAVSSWYSLCVKWEMPTLRTAGADG